MAHWIFVDYENVRPNDFHPDLQPDTHILVFLGPNQHRIPAELVMALQAFGPRARYIQCAASGKNALDFHIAFYLGEIAHQHSEDEFHIVSEDRGFDPLVQHMSKKRGITVRRQAELPTIPNTPKTPAPKGKTLGKRGTAPAVEEVRKALAAAGKARPRKVTTLKNWINTTFNRKLDEPELDRLVGDLRSRRLIVVNADKVSYTL